MQDLIARIVAELGVDEGLAQKAVGAVLSVLKRHAEQSDMSALLAAMPGAQDLLAGFEAAEGGSGSGSRSGGGGLLGSLAGTLGGSLGGALGGSLSTLLKSGLDQDELKQLLPMLHDYAKEQAGDELVGRVVAAVPGLERLG